MTADGWRRMHPIALVGALADSVKSSVTLVLAAVAILVPNRDDRNVVIAVAICLAALAVWTLVSPLATWLTRSYMLDGNGITLRHGILNRKRTTIGYDRIHTMTSSAPIYMRPFDVVRLNVTAAGVDASITLAAVPAALQLELEARRRRFESADTSGSAPASGAVAVPASMSSGSSAASGAVPAGGTAAASVSAVTDGTVRETVTAAADTAVAVSGDGVASAVGQQGTDRTVVSGRDADGVLVFRASVKDIVLFAVTDLGLFAAVFAVIGFIEQARDLVPEDLFDSAQDTVVRTVTASVSVLVGVVFAVVAALFVVSIIGALLRFYGFEVWRRGDDLVVVRGAFTRRVTTIAVDRIQTITIRRSLTRRLFHLCSVRLGLGASSVSEGEDADMNGSDVLPVISDARVFGALRRMLPEWDVRPMPVRRTGRGLLRYYLLVPAVTGAVVTAATIVGTAVAGGGILLWWTAAPVAVTAFWLLCRWLKSRSEGYAVIDARRIMATGASALTMITVFTNRSRVQSVERSTTIWREPRDVHALTLPLFVTNGVSELRFRALRGADADTLAAWAEPGGFDHGSSASADGPAS